MMMFFWLVLSARYSSATEIPLDRAEQSSTLETNNAARAIDSDISTRSCTTAETITSPWFRIYFKSRSTVDKVVIERAYSLVTSCNYTVSIYDGAVGTLCGSFYLGSK